jgi:hypothetical protein
MISRLALWALLAAALACRRPIVFPANQPIVLRGVGFAAPEAVLHDAIADHYLVSNVNGSPLADDRNGFISLVSPEGRVVALRWIDGAADSVTLNAPKGLAVAGDYLYVADLGTIRRFDRETGAPRGGTVIPGATSLTGVVAGEDGSVYFTDSGLRLGPRGIEHSGADAVYRFEPDGKLDTLARGEALGGPTAIAVSGDSVWVVNRAGELYRLAGGGPIDVVAPAKHGLDGLVVFGGEAYWSSREETSIFRGPPRGPFGELVTGLRAPAEFGHDIWRHRLLVPLPGDNAVQIVPLLP